MRFLHSSPTPHHGLTSHLAFLFALVVSAFSPFQSEAQTERGEFTDPAPPEVHEVPAGAESPEPQSFDRLTFHGAPKPLAADAVTADWPRFLGPNDDGTTPETRLLNTFPETGPALVWEMEKGDSYTAPVIQGAHLVYFHRLDGAETVECLHPETGKRYWSYSYPTDYRDRYGFNSGPRASAVLADGRVYTLGVTSILTCLDLKTGMAIWQRDLQSEFGVPQYFFGHGSCPLVYQGKVIVNMGSPDNLSVAAFDAMNGKMLWGTRHEWRSSYASPVVKPLQGKDRLLVFAGGESDPTFGGLMCIDPETGELFDAYPWRAERRESVNASSPVVVDGDRVFVSECYQKGGVLLELSKDLKWREVWKAPDFGMHWMTPVAHDGYLYGFRGYKTFDAWLAGYRLEDGNEQWREEFEWNLTVNGRDFGMSFLRGSLLWADDRFYAQGESGSFAILDLTPEGASIKVNSQLFLAPSTWSLPVVCRGLLYIVQHESSPVDGTPPRVLCYDLRAAAP